MINFDNADAGARAQINESLIVGLEKGKCNLKIMNNHTKC